MFEAGGSTQAHGGEGAQEASGGEGASEASGGEGAGPGTNCGCATGEALTLVDCGGGREFGGYTMTYLSDDGSTLIYAPSDTSLQSGLYLGFWSAEAGTTISEGYPLGLSGDGRAMLLSKGSASYYRDASGTTYVDAELRLLSQDGLVAAGVGELSGNRQAVTWTRAAGLVGTGVGASATILPVVTAVSADGALVGGVTIDVSNPASPTRRPFLWSDGTGPVFLGDPPADSSAERGVVSAISANGQYAAGVVHVSEDEARLFRYSVGSGMTDLGPCFSTDFIDCTTLPFDGGLSFSDDGSVLGGTLGGSSDPTAGHAFVYTEADGLTLIAPDDLTTVRGISSDGSMILGVVLDGTGTPFVWDETRGVRRLPELLTAADIDLSGSTFDGASNLSKDGKVVVVQGTCGGERAVFRVKLPE